jgi:hypothetical protein
MGKQFCPTCGSEEVDMDDEGTVCLNCGYRGEFPKKQMLIAEEEDEEESPIKKITKNVPKKSAMKRRKK